MPENLKHFANGRRGGLRAAEIGGGVVLGAAALLLGLLWVADPYAGHTLKTGLFLLALAGLAGLIAAEMVSGRYAAQTQFTCQLYGDAQLAAIDADVASAGCYYKALGLAVTHASLLSHGAGLVIVPLDDIANISCRSCGGKARLVLGSHAGGETLLPRFRLDQKARAELHDFAARLAVRNPQLTVGSGCTPANGQPADLLPGFFASDTAAGIQLQPDVLGPGRTLQKISYGKGLLGAVLGALCGCTLWGLVGLLGYMSGWIGLLVVILALYGFKMLAGRLDKAAGWISLAVALAMILPANYLVYSALVADALAEEYYVTLFDVLPKLFPVLQQAELLGQFWSEYAIGAGLTLVFGIAEVVGLTHNAAQQNGVPANAQGVPAAQTAGAYAPAQSAALPGTEGQTCYGSVNPAYLQPGTQPAAEAGPFVVRYAAGRAKTSRIVLYICGVLMIVLGAVVGLGIGFDGSVVAALILFLIFGGLGALYIFLGTYTARRFERYCITYDTQTVTLKKPNGQSFTCPWARVSLFQESAWTGCCLQTPYGRIQWNSQMPGWNHLANFARTYAVNARQ